MKILSSSYSTRKFFSPRSSLDLQLGEVTVNVSALNVDDRVCHVNIPADTQDRVDKCSVGRLWDEAGLNGPISSAGTCQHRPSRDLGR